MGMVGFTAKYVVGGSRRDGLVSTGNAIEERIRYLEKVCVLLLSILKEDYPEETVLGQKLKGIRDEFHTRNRDRNGH